MILNKVNLHKRALDENATALEKDVIYHLLNRNNDYNNIEDCIKEILEHGCISGCVSTLIYYTDTVSFFYKHKEEINKLLYNILEEAGTYNISKVFKNWDETDPLCTQIPNQNLLAWFGFEETLYRLALEWEVEL